MIWQQALSLPNAYRVESALSLSLSLSLSLFSVALLFVADIQ